ncbi:MAG: hypothetical protein AABW68_02625 [archaeon]
MIQLAKKHPALMGAVIGVACFVLIVGVLAPSVLSAPSAYGNPVVFGHNPADIEPGTFSGGGSTQYTFPGIVNVGLGTTQGLLNVGTSSGTQAAQINVQTSLGGSRDPHIKFGGDSFTPFLVGIDNEGAGAQKFKISNAFGSTDRLVILPSNGFTGIGTSTPTTLLDVAGAVHASGDVCTDASGGKCLSDLIDIDTPPPLTNGLQRVCFPAGCDPAAQIQASQATDMIATCPGNPGDMIVLSCGAQVRVVAPVSNAAQFREYALYPLYADIGMGQDGCLLRWDILTGVDATDVRGFVAAYCIPKSNPNP